MKLLGDRYLVKVDNTSTTKRKSGLIVHEEPEDSKDYLKGTIMETSSYGNDHKVDDVVYFLTLANGTLSDTVKIDETTYMVSSDHIFGKD